MRRGTLATLAALAAGVLLLALILAEVDHAVRDRGLPLSDASVIREQAAQKHLDPALIAAVIYAESKFDPRPSAAGAQGLMQILPATAYYLAHLSGGRSFTARDLASPRINVAYGSYYLRYLLDEYHGNVTDALAAYNGGESNVDQWIAAARAQGHGLTVDEIPFPETRAYVVKVLSAEGKYRSKYASELYG